MHHLLALASAGTIALFTDSGVLVGVAADALLHATIFAALDLAACPIRSVLLRRWRSSLVCRSSATLRDNQFYIVMMVIQLRIFLSCI